MPRHIRSEELMPAATGGLGRAKAAGGIKPRPRRRRRGAPAPIGNAGSAPSAASMTEQRPSGSPGEAEPFGDDDEG